MDLLGKPLQWAAALAVVATVIGAKAALRRRRRETRRPTVAPMGELKRRTLDGTVVPLSGTGLRPPAPSHAETFAHESDLELVYALAARIDERERGVGWVCAEDAPSTAGEKPGAEAPGVWGRKTSVGRMSGSRRTSGPAEPE